ncbi:MAG: penicillin-binding protein [Patescibacteria group bacterium]
MPIPQLRKTWTKNKEKQGRTAPKKSFKKRLFFFILKFAAISVVVVLLYISYLSKDLPNPNQLMSREVAQSTKIYDRSGENILYEIHGDQKRTLVTLNEIPDQVKQATIAIEDKNFYKHGGVSWWAIARTMVTNVVYRRLAGGSTLTQQFVKNAILSPEKKLTRKIKELVLSVKIEKKFSKDEILQMYLNEIPYGSNAYGIQAASQKYFGKKVQDISLAEAAILAALTQAPSRYSPYGPNKSLLLKRKDYVLDLMAEQGYISEAQRDEAKTQEIVFQAADNNIIAPHFVMYVKELLAEKYGEKVIEQDGLKIITTLDLDKQKFAEEAISKRTENYQQKYNASNAALIALDPKTGQILAMVGSRDYFNEEIDGQVNITLSSRQPGSSIKPIVYATLFEKGYTPNTILYDVVTNFSTESGKTYEPHNYDGKEHGPVSIRQALAGSLNIPAVKALYLAGVNNVIDTAEVMGYTTLGDRQRFGLSLVLGGAEVKLLEHANAFSAFARDGVMSPTSAILKVEDKDGKTIEEYKPSNKQVISSKVARLINSVLSDNSARAFIFGEKNYLTLPDRQVAAKTGTTNDFKDAWTIGYTPSLVAGVWVGNNDASKMKTGSDGSVLAAPIWHDFMLSALGDSPKESFKEAENDKTGKAVLDGEIKSGRTVLIDKVSGLLATSSTPPELIESKNVREHHCILFYVDKNDPLGAAPKDPNQDPQFSIWEKAVIEWAKKNNEYSDPNTPTEYDNLHTLENKPNIIITSPNDGSTISNKDLSAQVNVSSARGVRRVDYYLNNNFLTSSQQEPFNLNWDISFLGNGYHKLSAKACDDVENCNESSVNFNLMIKNNKIPEKTSLTIKQPVNGLALNQIDFPLNIVLDIKGLKQVAKTNILLKTPANDIPELITSVRELNNNETIISWGSSPKPGDYTLYGELYDWNGEIKRSNEINLVIK